MFVPVEFEGSMLRRAQNNCLNSCEFGVGTCGRATSAGIFLNNQPNAETYSLTMDPQIAVPFKTGGGVLQGSVPIERLGCC